MHLGRSAAAPPKPPTGTGGLADRWLAAASTVMFRYKAIVKTGAGDWSQPIALVVK